MPIAVIGLCGVMLFVSLVAAIANYRPPRAIAPEATPAELEAITAYCGRTVELPSGLTAVVVCEREDGR